MKYNPVLISYFFKCESTKYNVRQLLKFLIVLAAMVAVYSILFHFNISRFEELIIAEFPAMDTPLMGKTVGESRWRENFGVNVVGIWKRGHFEIPHPESRIERTSVLVLAGSAQNLEAFEEIYAFYHICQLAVDPVLIVGSGRVGDTIAERFKEHGRPLVD